MKKLIAWFKKSKLMQTHFVKGFLFSMYAATVGGMWFRKDIKMFKQMQKNSSSPAAHQKVCKSKHLFDKYGNAGSISYYFYQDLWAARKIRENLSDNVLHYDIGSRVDGFIAHLLAFRQNIVLIDIRPLPFHLDDGVRFVQADATELAQIEDGSLQSLSALCSLEHFGLGRYGDPVDPDAFYKAVRALQRVMAKDGRLYISVPVGEEVIFFNAMRVFNPKGLIEVFDEMDLVEFTVVDMEGERTFIRNADVEAYTDGVYCGLFEFAKR